MSNKKVSVQFTEDMKGFATFGQCSYEDGFKQGKEAGTVLNFHLTIKTDDVDTFVQDPAHEAGATGYVFCPELGGKCYVERGNFNLFVVTDDLNRRKMKYRLFFSDQNERALTLSGFKDVHNDIGIDVWPDTSTLYTNIYAGHVEEADEAAAEIVASGILHILIADFAKQMTTIRSDGDSPTERLSAIGKFGAFFAGTLWEIYAPSLMPDMATYQREIPLYTTEGVQDAEISTIPFHSKDKLGESLIRFKREECDDVVVLIHGLTSSSDMFIMPEHTNLVQYLLDQQFTDVWAIDCRMSNHFSYNLARNRYNLDDVALFDFPAAFARIRQEIGEERRIHVICHCLGSVTFMMSLFGKVVENITSVISNSVSLTPRIPSWSKVKLTLGPPMCEYVAGIEYMNPAWRREPGWSLGKILAWGASLYHKECNVPECHMLSFMWGTGTPALFEHDNLHDITHRRLGDLFGGVSVHYYRHVSKMVRNDNTAVKFDPANPEYNVLPDDYFQYAKEIDTPILFVTGENNRVFTDSNILTYKRLDAMVPGKHELHVYPGYGHQDIFMGKNCDQDIFPRMIEFLNRHRGEDKSS